MSSTDDVTPDPTMTTMDGNVVDPAPTTAPVDTPSDIPLWDGDGFVDLSDLNRYPFPQPEWGQGFYITESYNFAPLIASAVGLLALFVAGWFLWTSFRRSVAAVEALGENAVEAPPETLKSRKKEKLVTAILSGGVVASLVMTSILSLFSVLDLRGGQVDEFGEWAAERYPTALVSRGQAEALLEGQSVLLLQSGNAVPVTLQKGYDGAYYLVGMNGGELFQNVIGGTVPTNPNTGTNAPAPGSSEAPTTPDLSDQTGTGNSDEPATGE